MAPTALPNVLAADLPKVLPVAQTAPPPAAPQWPITPLPGESFADTMKRAVEAGKTVTPAQIQSARSEAIKKVPTVLAASLLAGPGLLLAGTGLPEEVVGGGIGGSAASGAVSGAASELINKGLHAASGENVFTPQSAEDVGESVLGGGLAGGAMGLFGGIAKKIFTSKLARGMVNESLGATSRDVTYGNPAKAILDEKISSPFTGDIEKYKAALRSGLPPEQAMISAGGRAAAVQKVINQLAPQLDQALSRSTAMIQVTDVIDRPLMQAANGIIDNRAMTQAEKDAALTQLGALQHSLKEGLPGSISPLQANKIKQAIGQRINWAGNVAVTDEVKPAYRAVYGAIKDAVNKSVPESASVNERLANLLSAQTDIEKLMKSEEVGQGKGALGSSVTGIARRAEAVAGRAVPAANVASQSLVGPLQIAKAPVGAAAGLFSPQVGSLRDMAGNQ